MKKTLFEGLQWKLIGKLLLRLVLFNAGFWTIALLMAFAYDAMGLYNVGDLGMWGVVIMAVMYIIGTLYCFYSAFATAAKYVQSIENGIAAVSGRQEIMEFPDEVKSSEMALRNLQYTIYYNEQAAREAEQRKNDLVVYLAHDLKTPLTSIIGYLSLLEESPDLPMEQRAKYTSITLDKAYRLEQLINEFFDITRFNLQSIELENNRIDLRVMLQQLVEEFYPLLEEKQLSVTVNVRDEIHLIGDADKLARVFDNLLRNAISYSYLNTTIEIRAWQNEGWAAIAVRNQGDEIPIAKIDRIFEKFFRTDSARQSRSGGAGLGLAIAKQIVEVHGGRLTVQSNPDYTEFMVALPLQRG